MLLTAFIYLIKNLLCFHNKILLNIKFTIPTKVKFVTIKRNRLIFIYKSKQYHFPYFCVFLFPVPDTCSFHANKYKSFLKNYDQILRRHEVYFPSQL